jgi:hypothetical protein
VEFCARLGLPFPAEPKRPYSSWWHALHEVGHWAVKPRWYIDYALILRDDIRVTTGELLIPEGIIPGVGAIHIERFSTYRAGNDLIPDIALYRDPTLGESEVRTWSLLMLMYFGWQHPFKENSGPAGVDIRSGDSKFFQPGSARVWFPGQIHNPAIRAALSGWGIDPPTGRFRARNDGFELPHPAPRRFGDLVANLVAIYQRYGTSGEWELTVEPWIEYYLRPRYIGRFPE